MVRDDCLKPIQTDVDPLISNKLVLDLLAYVMIVFAVTCYVKNDYYLHAQVSTKDSSRSPLNIEKKRITFYCTL